MTSHKPSCIPCPKCGQEIPISLRQILVSDVVMCPSCGFRLSTKKPSDKIKDKLKQMSQ